MFGERRGVGVRAREAVGERREAAQRRVRHARVVVAQQRRQRRHRVAHARVARLHLAAHSEQHILCFNILLFNWKTYENLILADQ